MTEFKIVAAGDGKTDKIPLLMVLKGDAFPDRYVPTVFENYHQDFSVDGTNYTLHFWDTAGQDEYDRLRPLSYSGANVVLLCFDFDSKDTFTHLSSWMKEIEKYAKGAKIILVGLKMNLREPGNPDHVTDEEVNQFVEKNSIFCFCPCSCKTGEGIDAIVPAIVKACTQKKKGFFSFFKK